MSSGGSPGLDGLFASLAAIALARVGSGDDEPVVVALPDRPRPGAERSSPRRRDPDRTILRERGSVEEMAHYEHERSGDPVDATTLAPASDPVGLLHGIPAALVARFLCEEGRTGGPVGELGRAHLRDLDAPLGESLPRLVAEHPARYATLTLRRLADELRTAQHAAHVAALSALMYAELPEVATAPEVAYAQLDDGTAELVLVDLLAGRISAALIVPYPPGVPVLMPGERFGAAGSPLLGYLAASEALEWAFPGLAMEIHGVQVGGDDRYRIPCLPTARQARPTVAERRVRRAFGAAQRRPTPVREPSTSSAAGSLAGHRP